MKSHVRRGRPPRAFTWGLVVALSVASFGEARRAFAGSFTFSWSAPDDCPSQERVEAQIARLVGGDLRLHDESDLRADVTVSAGAVWSATLTTEQDGQKGYRTLEAPSCQAAADAIALIVALSIDPDAVAASGPGTKAPPPGAPEMPPRKERPVRILASAHAQGRVGTLPEADVGVGIGLGLAAGRWRVDLRGTYGLRRDQVASLSSGSSGRFNIATGSLTGCIDTELVAVALGPCAVVEAGRASVTGYGATAGFSREVPWLALGGGVFSSLALSNHWRAWVEFDVLASLDRPDYVFQNMPGVVFKPSALGGRLLFDVSWQF